MFETMWNAKKLDKKWYDLIKAVKSDEKTDRLFLINITKRKIQATDGRQLLSITRNSDCDVKVGLYILSQDHYLVPAENTNERPYPDLSVFENLEQCTKTAKVFLGQDTPLCAMVHAINAFNCFINLDRYQKALTAIDELCPEDAHIYGYEDSETAKEESLKIEFIAEELKVLYVMMPIKETEKLLQLDDAPLFKQKENAA